MILFDLYLVVCCLCFYHFCVQSELEDLRIANEQLKAELERERLEGERFRKELEVTSTELVANRKLLDARRPSNVDDTKERLFTLEQDYLNLVCCFSSLNVHVCFLNVLETTLTKQTEILSVTQQRAAQAEQTRDNKSRELDNCQRLINEQNKTLEEYRDTMRALQSSYVIFKLFLFVKGDSA